MCIELFVLQIRRAIDAVIHCGCWPKRAESVYFRLNAYAPCIDNFSRRVRNRKQLLAIMYVYSPHAPGDCSLDYVGQNHMVDGAACTRLRQDRRYLPRGSPGTQTRHFPHYTESLVSVPIEKVHRTASRIVSGSLASQWISKTAHESH